MGTAASTMMLLRVAVGLALFQLSAAATCQDRAGNNGTRPNLCAKESGTPFCINTAKTGEDATWECRECDPDRGGDCDCAPGKYCVKDKSEGQQGMCKYYEKEVLSRACSMPAARRIGAASISTTLATLKKGFNDEMFCGKISYTPDGNYKFAEWIGTCVQGKCQVCSDFGAASVKYPNAVCGDRICVAGHFAEAVALNFSWEYFSHNPLIISSFLTFVVIAITSCFGTVHACIQMYKRMKKAKRKAGGGEGEMRA